MNSDTPSQKIMKNAIKSIPVEYFEWGTYPDHFKIEMRHRHDFGELLFFIEGSGTHEIDYENHDIQACSIHYIPRHYTHFLNRDNKTRGFTLSFSSDFFEKNQIHKFFIPLKHEPFVLNLNKEKFQNIIDQTALILYPLRQHKNYYQEKCFLLSIELLLNTIASYRNKYQNTSNKKNKLVRNFKYLVNTNFQMHRTVSWYANELNISSKHLGNQVKLELGISAKEYILKEILGSIKKQLLSSDKTLKQIAYEHQYSLSSLGKLFKKNVGLSMSVYRSYDK